MNADGMFRLDGKIAVVTGAASGLGRAFALGLADQGALVICADRNTDGAEETASLAKQRQGKAEGARLDVGHEREQVDFWCDIAERHGRVDVLINNAGISTGPQRLHELAVEDWDRLMAINLRGSFLCMRSAIPLMLAAGSGSIINISSIAGLTGYYPGFARLCVNYSASKAAIAGLTRQAAAEYGRDGIRINAIAPGWHGGTNLGAERRAQATPEMTRRSEEAIHSRVPMGRRGVPEDLVGLVVYLAGDASSYVTGQVIAHDGGWMSS
jgi:NAD(P)-dependent dehydrogenase (short-subunit alcohol dehydrogenase family)